MSTIRKVFFLTIVVAIVYVLINKFTFSSRASISCDNIDFKVTTPVAYQTYQRESDNSTNITIEGEINTTSGNILVDFLGAKKYLSKISKNGNKYSGTISNVGNGQGTMSIYWNKDNCTKAITIPYVGIGDVYLVAGQSNQTNVGLNKHSYVSSKYKATLFGNDYKWKELKDPADSALGQVDTVSADSNNGGTYLPLLATKIMSQANMPVAFITAAKGGTKISNWSRNENNHVDRKTLYGSALYRAKLQKNIKAVLWWQGESDVIHKTGKDVYTQALIKLASNFQQDMNSNVSLITYQIGQVYNLDTTAIRQAIITSSNIAPNKIILGPDLKDVSLETPVETQKIHFVSDNQQQTVANRVFDVLKTKFY